ncbi:WD domain, G-beta repeat protein, partial [Teladorsagia circumcincta]
WSCAVGWFDWKQVGGKCGEVQVLSVEWSSDRRYLASASMDNTVVVWNAKKLPERIVVLDTSRGGHNGPVKGLSWDPIGKYLATQSADK